MLVTTLNQAIEEAISECSGIPFSLAGTSGMGGGCINDASRATGLDGRVFFIKRNSVQFLPAFETEAHALETMAASRTIRVPIPVATCSAAGQCALILEYLDMGRPGNCDWRMMGTQLARMHRQFGRQHGWDQDNWIGSTPQINNPHADWVSFYRECRLRPQIKWARKKHLSLGEADALLEKLPSFFADYEPAPSLLHGDLWSGNAGFLTDGSPVIYDPASYYGDRETDLAMTEMFGGFPREFYAAYDAEWAIDPGYKIRKHLYILYHTLNHYNIFGGGYGYQAEAIVGRLLAGS